MPKSLSTSLDSSPKRVLAIDPGKATGWAIFENCLPRDYGTCRGMEEFQDWLVELKPKPDVIVVENFKLFKWKAMQQSGSDMPASQVLGMVKMYAKSNNIPVVEQSSQILPIAQIWSKMKMPSNHDNSHHISAYNHAVYYLVSNNWMKPVGMV